jgi:hypothetical protein
MTTPNFLGFLSTNMALTLRPVYTCNVRCDFFLPMHMNSPFCPKGTFENLILCYFPENFFHFREKNGILGKLFSYLGKNAICPENFFRYVRKKIFEMPFFILKVPLKACPPPQLLEASYAPVCTSSEHS